MYVRLDLANDVADPDRQFVAWQHRSNESPLIAEDTSTQKVHAADRASAILYGNELISYIRWSWSRRIEKLTQAHDLEWPAASRSNVLDVAPSYSAGPKAVSDRSGQ